jgi:hypothetical protein
VNSEKAPSVSDVNYWDKLETVSALYGTDLPVSFTDNSDQISFKKLGQSTTEGPTVSVANQLLVIMAGSLGLGLGTFPMPAGLGFGLRESVSVCLISVHINVEHDIISHDFADKMQRRGGSHFVVR